MPIDTWFDADNRLLHVVVGETWPTLQEITAERLRLIARGFIQPGVVELVDARAVTRAIPNLSQMRAILDAIGKPPHKRAIVVATNLQLKAGRLAELLDPEGLKIFREESNARAWLLGPNQGNGRVELDRSRSARVPVVWNLRG